MRPTERNEVLPRVAAWLSDTEVDPTDFTYGVFQAAIDRGATEILLTPTHGEDEVRVDFKIDGTYFRQPPITRIQFGFIAIHLAHIANRVGRKSGEEKLFQTADGRSFRLRFWKVLLADRIAAVTIHIESL